MTQKIIAGEVMPHELMIGNYLQDKEGRLCKVERIIVARHGEDFDAPAIQGPVTSMPNSPIPLTEDWLLRFGFTQNLSHKNLYFKDQFRYQLNKRYITMLRPCDKAGESQQNECGYPFLTDRIECEYVHQLQNLYFALTGTHLTLTQKPE